MEVVEQSSMMPLTNCKEQDVPTHGVLYGVREKAREVGRGLILKALFDRLKSLNFVVNYENY